MSQEAAVHLGRHRDERALDDRAKDSRYYDFRTQLRVVETGDWLSTLERVGRAWFAEKGVELSPGTPATRSVPGTEAQLARLTGARGAAVRLTLVEQGDQGEWRTEVLGAAIPDGSGWISVTTRNSESNFVNRPRIVTRILEEIEVLDGHSELVDDTWLITAQHVREFLQILADPDRTFPVFVTGAVPGGDVERHSGWMRSRSKELAGLAHSYVVDADSAEALGRVLGQGVAVRPWSIRSFAPVPVPHDPEDALRHRVIGARRLQDLSASAARALVGRIARFEAAERPEAPALREARRDFDRMAVRERFRRPSRLEPGSIAPSMHLAEPHVERGERPEVVAPTPAGPQNRPDHEASPDRAAESQSTPGDPRPGSGTGEPSAPGTTSQDDHAEDRPTAPAERVEVPKPPAPVKLAPDGPLEGEVAPEADPEPEPTLEPEPATEPKADPATEPESGGDQAAPAVPIERALLERLFAITGAKDLSAVVDEFETMSSMLDDAASEAQAHLEVRDLAQDVELELRGQLDDLERELSSEVGRRRTAEQNARVTLRFGQDDVDQEPAPEHPADLPAPDQFSDIALMLEELHPFVVFTGDLEIVAALDEFDTNRVAAGKCWDGLLALHGYASAHHTGVYGGSLFTYLQEPPDGFSTFPVGQYAAGESETTMQRRELAAQRLLPVPVEVDPSGRAHMWAHLKIRKLGRVSPRLHFLDGVANHGTVYVGYIGPHLGIAGS